MEIATQKKAAKEWESANKEDGKSLPKTPIILIYKIVKFFEKIEDNLNNQTLIKYYAQLYEVLEFRLTNLTKEDLKEVDQELIDNSFL